MPRHRIEALTRGMRKGLPLIVAFSLCHVANPAGMSTGHLALNSPSLATVALQTATQSNCHTLLTDMEVETVMGRPSAGAVTESASGSSQCRWEWPGSDATVTASFASEGAIRAGAAATKCCPSATASAVAQFFDYTVRSEQDLGSDLPVPLDGLGQRAVLFFDDAFLKVIVQRADGVLQVSGHVTREQLLALARAMVR